MMIRPLVASLCLLALVKASPTPGDPADIVPEDTLEDDLAQTAWGSSCPSGTNRIPWGLFRPKGPHNCIPADYMKISCPVVRALAGSGFLKYETSSGAGQYLTSAPDLLKTMQEVLGFKSDEQFQFDTTAPFKGINTATHFLNSEIHQVDPTTKMIDLMQMQFFLNHAASTGILGSATHTTSAGSLGRRLMGSVFGKADQTFNKARLDNLNQHAGANGFTPKQFGDAVDFFAKQRYDNRNAAQETRVDMAWNKNPFSWAILTLEFSNTLAVFKNKHFLSFGGHRWGGRTVDDNIDVQTINDIWENGHLPTGWRTQNKVISMNDLKDTVVQMKISMPPELITTMTNDNREAMKAFKKVTRRLCGGDLWPNCVNP